MATAPTMSQKDQDALKAAGDAWNAANAAGDEAGKAAAHAQAEAIRNSYGYSGGGDGSQVISTESSSRPSQDIQSGSPGYSSSSSGNAGGANSSNNSGSSTGTGNLTANDMPASPEQNFMSPDDYNALKQAGADYLNATTDAERQAAHAKAEEIRAKYNYSGGTAGDQYIPLNQQQQISQTPNFSGLLDQWLDAAKQQQQNQIDYAVNQGVAELERAEEDAQEQFQTQQNQVSEDEAKALDNQALYAEARGDRGGIGQAQYGQIQAQAMQNRQAINTARTKLSTDTARAIADLRAQGEFQKADALLQLTQTYLSQLIQLQQWGAEYSLNVQQFNAQLQQWEKEFELSVGDLMGEYQGQPTWSAQQAEKNTLIDSGMAALSVGVRPSAAQQQAMGYTDAQIDAILAEYKLSQMASGGSSKGSSGGSSSGVSSSGNGTSGSDYDALFSAARSAGSNWKSFIANNYKKYGFSSTTGLYDEYEEWLMQVEEIEDAEIDLAQATKLVGQPVSGKGLAYLEENGIIRSYVEDGYIRFQWTDNGARNRLEQLLRGTSGLPNMSILITGG